MLFQKDIFVYENVKIFNDFFMTNEAISLELLTCFGGTLKRFNGTLGFRGTQFEELCSRK